MVKNSVCKEYLERLNFLYLCEQFPDEMVRHAGHATYKRLCAKYGTEIVETKYGTEIVETTHALSFADKRCRRIAEWLI